MQDHEGKILFVRRSDNGRWVMPERRVGIGLKPCSEGMTREVKEETGLEVVSARPMGIYTYPASVTAYGDPYYQLSVQFLVEEWAGTLLSETDETVRACFFPIDRPPEGIASHYHEVLEDLRKYDGRFILK